MKKTKFIVLALAMAVLLLGAGYAYWDDQLSIDNTVTTGELNVDFVHAATNGRDNLEYPGYVLHDNNSAVINELEALGKIDSEDSYGASAISEDGKSFTTLIGNLYPGSHARVSAEAVNNGTIPAKIENVSVSIGGNTDLASNMSFTVGYIIVDEDENVVHNGSSDIQYTWGDYLTEGEMGLADRMNDLLQGVVLNPGEKLHLDIPEDVKDEALAKIGLSNADYSEDPGANCMFFQFPGDAAEGDEYENADVSIDVTFDWTQYNDPGESSAD